MGKGVDFREKYSHFNKIPFLVFILVVIYCFYLFTMKLVVFMRVLTMNRVYDDTFY